MTYLDVFNRLVATAMCPTTVTDELIDDPGWNKTNKCHDWRNYISSEVQEVWEHLPLLARLVAYLSAEEQAGREEWD